jgi:nucleoside-diphosphate-sugar epimerase
MKVLIPGGAGYIGSVLVGRLLNEGHQVTVLDNLFFQQRSLFGYATNPNFDFVYGDCRDKATLEPLMAKADAVIHLAAVVGMPACKKDPEYSQSLNYGSAKLVADLSSKDQILIYPCTNSGYGTQSGELHCDENTPLSPISLYGTSKAEGEKAILDSGNGMAFRLATVFGTSPRMRIDLLVNDFTYKAVSQGAIVLYEKHFKRNFVGIQDVASAMIYAMNNFGKMKGEVYNLGLDAANMSKEELAQKIKEHVPNFYFTEASVGSDPDKRNYIVSNEKLRKAGFEATQSIDDGIRELLKVYRMFGRNEYGNV